jgi:hypothetical protein
MKPLVTLLLGVFTLAAGASAGTILNLGFTNSPVSGVPGGVATFIAQATNTAAVTEFLNGDSFTLTGTPFTSTNFDTSAFLNQWPLSLTAGQSFGPATIFQLTIPTGTAPGSYSGSFNILGGPGASDQNLIGSASFQVDVSAAAPEPGTSIGLLSGIAAILVRRLRGRRA